MMLDLLQSHIVLLLTLKRTFRFRLLALSQVLYSIFVKKIFVAD